MKPVFQDMQRGRNESTIEEEGQGKSLTRLINAKVHPSMHSFSAAKNLNSLVEASSESESIENRVDPTNQTLNLNVVNTEDDGDGQIAFGFCKAGSVETASK